MTGELVAAERALQEGGRDLDGVICEQMTVGSLVRLLILIFGVRPESIFDESGKV
jgi:hypothetical protein